MAADVALSQALAYARDLKVVCEVWQERERELKHVNARLRASHRQSLRYAADLKKTYWRMERAFLNSLLALANALEARDVYTRGHSDRVAASARALALASGLTSPVAETVAQAGRLHDLGKIGVPESVLGKGGPLTDEEWAVMRLHPLTGAQILAPLEFFGEGMLIVRHHPAPGADRRRGRRLRRAHVRPRVSPASVPSPGDGAASRRGGTHARRRAGRPLRRYLSRWTS